jgi:hypothetical protein
MKLNRESLYIGLFGSVIGALLGATATISTSGFGYLNKDRELDIKMVEIGLSILNGEKTKNSQPARDFAVSLLGKYADVEIKYREDWVQGGDVPYSVIYLMGNTLTKDQSKEIQKCLIEEPTMSVDDCREKLEYGRTEIRVRKKSPEKVK